MCDSTCFKQVLCAHSQEFLAWAVNQELSTTKGGLLADEMGMGKTIQVCTAVVVIRISVPSCNVQPAS